MKSINLKIDRMRFQTNQIGYALTLLSLAISLISLFTLITYDEFSSGEDPIRVIPDLRFGIEISLAIVLMLMTFLAAEKVRYYHPFWSIYGLFVLAGINLLRIFNIPFYAFEKGWIRESTKMVTIIEFAVSAGLLVIAGIVSLIKVLQLRQHLKETETS
ncbi:MAG: hypothetical protein WCR28_00970 [Candidatus Izemoplasmatales bacterium]|nr:hypothetical protein [Candidatus Izemoplasmatales bacterium]MDD4987443.1 hypothetical protein [Candidatus Izemoplasmatales bacterium]MDY0373500.1 hypothetical protein [Candidatus Izemoplasmatales bacterium]NLF48798.1 hypothetical protein [Acholeplasmataceae bacterium]